jgi:hypothetical protein
LKIHLNWNHPYLYRIYVSCINIELLSVWTQICTCFAFDKAVKLATIGFTSGMTADLACQMSSCLYQDYNSLLLFKRDILYTGNVEYILLSLCLKRKSKILNRHSIIYNNHVRLAKKSSGKSSSRKSSSFKLSMEILVNLAHAQQISQLLGKKEFWRL